MKNGTQSSWFNERGQLVLMTAGVAGLLFLMFQLDHLFNPLGYGLIVGIVLYPIRMQPVARAILYATGFAAGMWLLYDSGHLLIPFIAAFLIAFLINPWVMWLEAKGVPRWIVASIATTIGLLVIALFAIFALPIAGDQLVRLSRFFLVATNNTDEWIEGTGILSIAANFGFDPEVLKSQLSQQIGDTVRRLVDNVTGLKSGVVSSFGDVLTGVFFVILLPFLLFFTIRDYDKIGGFVRSLIGPQGAKEDYTIEIGKIIGGYVRGIFIVVVISAINLSLGFAIAGVPYALLLGLFAGLTNFIPTFGLWLSVFVCSVVGITLGDPWYQYLPGIYIVFAVEQVLETGYIVPRVVGKQVGLHPLVVMISLLIFGFMFGFLGLIIAVPSVALMSIFYQQYKKTRKISFLSGSELDVFLKEFEPPTRSAKKAVRD